MPYPLLYSLFPCTLLRSRFGCGFIATKPGRSKASKLLTGPFGLSFRLLRTPFLAWAVGMFALGAAYGSVLGDLEGFIESSELVRQMIPEQEGLSMTEGFIALIIAVLSILGAVPVLMFTLKLRNEEKKNRTEALLSNAVSRRGVLGGYLLVALLMSVTVQIMSALGLWSAAVAVMEEAVSLKTLITAALVHVPHMADVGTFLLLVGFSRTEPVYMAVLDLCLFRHLYGRYAEASGMDIPLISFRICSHDTRRRDQFRDPSSVNVYCRFIHVPRFHRV